MGYITLPELSYREWSGGFHEKLGRKRIPISGSLELTFRCNNRCVHCYCGRLADNKDEFSRELRTEEITHLIDQIVDSGCLWFLLTGGEPLIREDFKHIYLYAKKKGLLITLFTNGTLVTEEMADFLAEWKPFSTEITLYGFSEDTYGAITRVKDSFRLCMNGIERLHKRQIPLKLKTMAMTANIHELPEMHRYADSLGLEFRFDPIIHCKINGRKDPTHYRLSPEEVVTLDIKDDKRANEWLRLYRKNISSHSESDRLYTCGAGLSSFHIDPYGNLCVCMMARKESYNLKNGSFMDGWCSFANSMREKVRTHNTACRTCEISSLCVQCPGWAQLEHGDDETPVEYLCSIAYKRAEALKIKV